MRIEQGCLRISYQHAGHSPSMISSSYEQRGLLCNLHPIVEIRPWLWCITIVWTCDSSQLLLVTLETSFLAKWPKAGYSMFVSSICSNSPFMLLKIAGCLFCTFSFNLGSLVSLRDWLSHDISARVSLRWCRVNLIASYQMTDGLPVSHSRDKVGNLF